MFVNSQTLFTINIYIDTNECEVLESLETFILNNFDAWKDEVVDCRKNNSFDDCSINSTYIQVFIFTIFSL